MLLQNTDEKSYNFIEEEKGQLTAIFCKNRIMLIGIFYLYTLHTFHHGYKILDSMTLQNFHSKFQLISVLSTLKALLDVILALVDWINCGVHHVLNN